MGDVVVRGKRHPVPGPVKLWTETGLETAPGRGARKRRRRIDLGVWHWTGGEGSAETLFRVLTKRQLGVEFYIGHDGTIWQFCDPALVDTFDAGRVNDRSFGVEIACYGFKWGKDRKVPAKGRGRPTYRTVMNGRTRTFAHFWPAQIAAAVSLADAMSRACSILRRVPMGSEYWVEPCTLSEERLDAFQGHLGHYHVTSRKSDPGLDLLEAMRATFSTPL